MLTAAGCCLFLPGFPVSLAAMLVSKVLACTLAFLLGRALAGDAVKRGLRQAPSVRLRAMVHAMEKHPWRITLLLRLAYLPVGQPLSVVVSCIYCMYLCLTSRKGGAG